MSDDTEQPVMKGTPITRGGGSLVRIGWRAEGYSVNTATERAYQFYSVLLFAIAVSLGVVVAYGADFLFFTYAAPLAAKVVPDINNYPRVFQLLIYYSTLFFGGLIFWYCRGRVGAMLVRGSAKLHDGYDLLEQRRRASVKRKRVVILLALGAVGIWMVPLQMTDSLRLFLTSLPVLLLAEGIFFTLWKPKH